MGYSGDSDALEKYEERQWKLAKEIAYNNTAHFVFYEDESLWYVVRFRGEQYYLFPVPVLKRLGRLEPRMNADKLVDFIFLALEKGSFTPYESPII